MLEERPKFLSVTPWDIILCICIVIGLMLLCFYWPDRHSLLKAQTFQTVSNLRQIFLACYRMAEDGESVAAQDDRALIGWPGELAVAPIEPVRSLPQFVSRLVDHGYMEEKDVGRLFAAPGVRARTVGREFKSENSAFKIYHVTKSDDPSCLFAATKNFIFGHDLLPHTAPYGDKACVIFRKGGDGFSLTARQARDPRLSGCMPGHTMANPGVEGGNFWE